MLVRASTSLALRFGSEESLRSYDSPVEIFVTIACCPALRPSFVLSAPKEKRALHTI